MTRFPASSSLPTNSLARPRRSGPRIRAELKPLSTSRLFLRPEPLLAGLWAPERLARLHEPLTRYHD